MESNYGNKYKLLNLSAFCLVTLLITAMVLTGCGAEEPTMSPGETILSVSSTTFNEGEIIPAKYTCDGEDISPQISWEQPPAGTKSLAVIMDDLDAPMGVFTHWVIYNIPAEAGELAEAVPAISRLEDGTLQGTNSFKKTGYGGPCPPSGTHRYRFTVYALDITLDLEAEADKKHVAEVMEGHILARGMITGNYGE